MSYDSARGRRNDAIARLGVLERRGDPGLTGLTRVASYITGARAAAVHILDDVAQHRVAATGVELVDHPREDSLCRLVVDSEQRIVCEDATRDPRFGYSSFVEGNAPVRFYLAVPLETSDGAVIGALCAFDTVEREVSDEQVALLEDVAQQVVSQIELIQVASDLSHAASHDPLTGAVNRLVLGDRLAQAFARRRRNGGDTFVAVLDIDDFKSINDDFGHAAGDEVLVEVARRLHGAMRDEDTIARIGGDEFVVLAELMPPLEPCAVLTDRIRHVLAEPITCAGAPRPVGVSVGCTLAQPGEDVRTLLARADAAMYERKGAGRPLSRAGR